jgi:hypothetical protein
MTTATWIYIGGTAVAAAIVTRAFYGLRSYRSKLRRRDLPAITASGIIWLTLAAIFWDPVFSTLLAAGVAGIYLPSIYSILRSPADSDTRV